VVHEGPRARYRIAWDDGRTSVYAPAAGALRIAPDRQAGERGDARAPLSIATASKPRTVTTTSGPIEVERPGVRNAQALGMGR
jgi:hypothetical protein